MQINLWIIKNCLFKPAQLKNEDASTRLSGNEYVLLNIILPSTADVEKLKLPE
jgi:hypothetical protein